MTGTLFTLFAESARRYPDAVALEVGGTDITYAKLRTLADALGGQMIRAAGQRPAVVGLLASRSVAAFAGYLAALRLGATVVPLNPSMPARRNGQMCRDAAVEVVVVDDAGIDQAATVLSGCGAVATVLSGDWIGDTVGAQAPHGYCGRPDDVAYVLFTSGTTGKPKGVPIRHRHVTEYLTYCANRYSVGPGSRLSQSFELTFDPSVFDMFVGWAAGAAVVVPQADEVLTPVRFINDRHISHWFSVPSVIALAARLRMLRPGCMPGLRFSLFAGEQLTLDQATAWSAAAPRSVLENLYGPTELTITCTGYRLPADPSRWPRSVNGTVPIGRPNPGLETVVLDETGRATIVGELCVRGRQRFDGYLDANHDDGRFVRYRDGMAEPVVGRPALDDWYCTGDVVRTDAGELVHLGRLDDQLKLHGYRIEIGEIEWALRGHPGVDEAAVVPVDAAAGRALFAAYTGDAGLEDALPAMLRERLPAYMVPQTFRRLDSLPINANGKVDRKHLVRIAAGLAAPVGGDRR